MFCGFLARRDLSASHRERIAEEQALKQIARLTAFIEVAAVVPARSDGDVSDRR